MGRLSGFLFGHPVGIDPCVQFQSPFMGFLNPELKGIKTSVRRGALFPGKIPGPGENTGLVKCVGRRPHLQENGVKTGILGQVQDPDGFALQFGRVGGGLYGIVDISPP